MGKANNQFFSDLEWAWKSQHKPFKLQNFIYDELTMQKNSRDNEAKQYGGRLALKRIERLQELGLLELAEASLKIKPDTYADELILKIIQDASKAKPAICLITEDTDLRIRARDIAKKSGVALQLLSIQEFSALCAEYKELQVEI